MVEHGDLTSNSDEGSLFRIGATLAIALVVVLAAMLLLLPASAETLGSLSNAGQLLGNVFILGLWLARLYRFSKKPASLPDRKLFWAQLGLGFALCFETVAQLGWAINEEILHVSPFPSWTDVAYLAYYPCLFGAIFLFPGRRSSTTARIQVGVDAAALTTVVATFSWYFLIGPVVLASGASRLEVVVSALYPIFDLVLLACLVILWVRSDEPRLRPVLGLLTASIVIVVVGDSIFQYQALAGTFQTGSIIDVAWVAGDLLLGLAAIAFVDLLGRRSSTDEQEHLIPPCESERLTPPWLEYLPYLALPLMIGFFMRLWNTPGDGDDYLEPGVLLGCIIFVVLIIVRQFLALRENQRLHNAVREDAQRLAEVNRQLVDSNNDLIDANERLESLATTDPLTGLLNHRGVNGRIDQEIERAYRYGRKFSLLFIDLDHFKTINDSYGHGAGDVALNDFATLIRENLRGVDVVARWGGEEFLVILPEIDETVAVDCAERLRQSVAAHRYPIGGGIHITCSIGVATYPDRAYERGMLIELADQAMYAAKRLGRNQVRRTGETAVTTLASLNGASRRDDATLVGVVEALAAMVEARDRYTGRHMAQVGRSVVRLALRLGLDANESHMLGMAGLLHDIGKVGVPDAILQTPVNLTRDQWAAVRLHTIVGSDVVSRVPALRKISPIIRAHHERWDGKGYPDRLVGEEIPYGARIVAVVDAFGAITSNRPYRVSRSREDACAELRRGAGRQFDPAIVEAFLAMIEADGDDGFETTGESLRVSERVGTSD